MCGYAERADERIYNSAILFGADGARLFNYRKLHLSGAYEKATFELGDEVVTARIDGVTIAPLICYDVEFPEAVRAAARAGAQVVCVPTALREQYARLADTMIPTRAFENGFYVAYVNQAGAEGDWDYCGLSRLAGPDGRVVATAGQRKSWSSPLPTPTGLRPPAPSCPISTTSDPTCPRPDGASREVAAPSAYC